MAESEQKKPEFETDKISKEFLELCVLKGRVDLCFKKHAENELCKNHADIAKMNELSVIKDLKSFNETPYNSYYGSADFTQGIRKPLKMQFFDIGNGGYICTFKSDEIIRGGYMTGGISRGAIECQINIGIVVGNGKQYFYQVSQSPTAVSIDISSVGVFNGNGMGASTVVGYGFGYFVE